jgi:hypothetical protein
MSSLSDVPASPHFAIIRTTSVTIPGDERSRTHPGHGYPENTERFVTYRAFADRDEWEAEIRELSNRQENFRALVVTPAKVITATSVTIEA